VIIILIVSIISVSGTYLGSLGYNTTYRIDLIIFHKAQETLVNIALATVTEILPYSDGFKM
jgi:hypothetical protein